MENNYPLTMPLYKMPDAVWERRSKFYGILMVPCDLF